MTPKNETLTLKKQDTGQAPVQTTAHPAVQNEICSPDRYNAAREIIRDNLLVIAGGVCPGHESIMCENVLRAMDELIAAALDIHFEKSFGPVTNAAPETPRP